MDLLQALGLGNTGQGPQWSQELTNSWRAMQQYQPLQTCIHIDCPICQKEYANRAKQIQCEAISTAHRKELYKERCKEYMTKFRAKYKIKGEI